MAVKVGISGFGRISRVVIRAAYGDESVENVVQNIFWKVLELTQQLKKPWIISKRERRKFSFQHRQRIRKRLPT